MRFGGEEAERRLNRRTMFNLTAQLFLPSSLIFIFLIEDGKKVPEAGLSCFFLPFKKEENKKRQSASGEEHNSTIQPLMPDSIEETDVGHAGWISGCVLLFFLLSLPFFFKEEGKRKKEEVTSQEFLAGNLLFYFSLPLIKD